MTRTPGTLDLLRASGGRRYAAVLAVDAVGGGLLRPFLVLYGITVLGLDVPTAGLALTGGLLAGLAALPAVGRWIDRGARSTVVAGLLGIRAAGTVVLLAADGPAGFVLAATMLGIGNQAFPAAHAAVVATLTTGRARDTALAATRSLRNAGLGVGALLATLAVSKGDSALWWLAATNAAAVLLATGLVLGSPLRAPARTGGDAPAEPPWPGLTRLLLANLPFALCFAVLEVVLPALVVTRLHASPAWSAGMFVGNTVLVIVAQVALVRRLARWPRATVLAWSGAVLALSYVGFWAAGTVLGTALVCVLYTFGEILYAGSSTALVVATSPPGQLGRALARFQLSSGLGIAVAPALLTALLAAGTGVLWCSLAGTTALAAAAVWRMRTVVS
jgi:MFS family permease